MNIKPLADRVLIRPTAAEEVTIGGIIIPDTAKEKPLKGEIIAVGNGTKDEEMILKAGDIVLYGKYAGTEIELEGEKFLIMRQSDVLAVIAYFIAINPNAGSIMGLVENAWAGFGAAFGPVIILSLFWKRFTYKGAIAGIIGGGATVIVWIALGLSAADKTGIYELLPGFIVCLVLAVVVSLIDKAPSAEVTAIFDKATSGVEE